MFEANSSKPGGHFRDEDYQYPSRQGGRRCQGVVAHIGLHALGRFADQVGLADSLSSRLHGCTRRVPLHDRGKLKDNSISIAPLSWHSAPGGSDHRLCSSLFFTSGSASCSAWSGCRCEQRPTTPWSCWCCDTRSASSNVSCTLAFGTGQRIGRSSRRSAGCFQERFGGRSSSHPRPCCVGTARREGFIYSHNALDLGLRTNQAGCGVY